MLMYYVFSLFFLLGFVQNCDSPRKGFIKKKDKCVYDLGCENDDNFFLSQAECYESLINRNPCFRRPCMNGGICTQITKQPFYKCKCAGTGFHGLDCSKSCSELKIDQYEFDCVVI